ncbi:MAG TPA: hypothetical protein VFV81_02570, partial [Verrucomicrobiae bacterium]|nr:hypothetical protein [Verrucomicrobiae bacterium]
RRVNAPLTSSAGRLFDAIASLAGLRQTMNFEGQAAMELEFCRDALKTDQAYHFSLQDHRWREEAGRDRSQLILDWEPVVQAILADLRRGTAPGTVSAKFHNALAEAIVGVAKRVGEPRVLLSGGCFQNRYLTERTVVRLRAEGFQPAWHHHVPANDGGIALGQLVAAHRAAAQPLQPAPSIHRMNLCALPSPEKSKASAAKTH